MKIILLDHHITEKRKSVWKECLEQALTCHDFRALPDDVNPASLPVQPDILLLHTDPHTESDWRAWHKKQPNSGTVIAVVSTQARRKNPEEDGWYGCFWHPEDFKTVPQAQEFLRHLKDGKFVPELLWPQGVPAVALAYLLAKQYRIYEDKPEELTRLRRAAVEEFANICRHLNATDDEIKDWFLLQGY